MLGTNVLKQLHSFVHLSRSALHQVILRTPYTSLLHTSQTTRHAPCSWPFYQHRSQSYTLPDPAQAWQPERLTPQRLQVSCAH